jgi:hypothetical protein
MRTYGELNVGPNFHLFLISVVEIGESPATQSYRWIGPPVLLNKMLNGPPDPPEQIYVGEKTYLPAGNQTPFV